MAAKAAFDDVYERLAPEAYYRAYYASRLSIAEYIAALIRRSADLGVLAEGAVVDLGCGYGTLGALLRTGLSVEELYEAYLRQERPQGVVDDALGVRLVGVDRSEPALTAAKEDGLIDECCTMDLNAPNFRAIHPLSLVTCSAVLGYMQPWALRRGLEQLGRPMLIVTCVTWVVESFLKAFSDSAYTVQRLAVRPVFQRWGTEAEHVQMPECLVAGAHRAECFLLTTRPFSCLELRETLEDVRRRRITDSWLAAGRGEGCELT